MSYTFFKNQKELEVLERQVSYDLIIVDYDYADEDSLVEYNKLSQELVLLTKSFFMKKIDSMHLNVFKRIYEPLNNSKLRQALDNYHTENFGAKKTKKINRKKFNADTSKFNANILIAEDNIINQKLIKRTLEDLGLNITIASNGLEAFQKRKDGNFDLVFMDIQMPFLDGMEATKEILEWEETYNQVHVPIVALTANALKGDRERFLAAGLDEYTTKPLVRAEIISLLNIFLADFIVDTTSAVQDAKEIVIPEVIPTIEEFSDETIEVVIEKEPVSTKPVYSFTHDILLAKKSSFESKLYSKVLTSLGYSFDTADSVSELETMSQDNTYKVILFDKECKGLNLATFASSIQEANASKELKTNLLLINSTDESEDPNDLSLVDESIKNVVNKDLLRLLIEKFIS